MNSSRPLTLLLALAATAATGCDTGSAQDSPPAEQAAKSEPSDASAVTKTTCEHVATVAHKAEPGLTEAELGKLRSQCGESLDQLARRHHSLTTCILAAGNVDEIVACEAPAYSYDSVLSTSAGTSKAVCAHVMEVMKREMGSGFDAPSSEDTKKFLHKCVTDLAEEQEKIGPVEFRKQSKCVLASKTMADMMRCEPRDN